MTENWTQNRVRALIAAARTAEPKWSWKLLARPETVALLVPAPGLVWHPDPRFEPLEVLTFDDCELHATDLIADVVLASPVDEFGCTPNEPAASYWLDLSSDQIDVWSPESLAKLQANQDT